MVGKDHELGNIDVESLARVKLISSKKRELEEKADQIRNNIKSCFDRLSEILRGREKQLLRQVEAIHRQHLSLIQTNSELLPTSSSFDVDLRAEEDLSSQLLSFGKIDLSNSIAVNDSEPYKVEEYQEASEDYVSFEKSLKSETNKIDVTSVLRRKRDSKNVNKIISIKLNHKPCETCNAISTLAASASKEPDDESEIPEAKTSSKIKDTSFTLSISTIFSEQNSQGKNLYFEDKSSSCANCVNIARDLSNDNNASKIIDNCLIIKSHEKTKDASVEHPIQIQQWLQQILAETETEPIIHEIGQFTKIPNTRLYREFPVET